MGLDLQGETQERGAAFIEWWVKINRLSPLLWNTPYGILFEHLLYTSVPMLCRAPEASFGSYLEGVLSDPLSLPG